MSDPIVTSWRAVYGHAHDDALHTVQRFVEANRAAVTDPVEDWREDAIVYALYVDAFAGDFDGLITRLDHLIDLGVNTLWLLPILKSPMRDQGFDISDYRDVRADLGGLEAFKRFLAAAREAGLKIVFDIAVNHTSDEHPWFVAARASRENEHRNRYIWSDTTDKYADARLLFKGMVPSNWEPNPATGDHYFHRFYAFQPDLNYRNPQVLIDMIKTFAFWTRLGADGLRMDAIPFLWKEDGTLCEDLDQTHHLLKIFRAVIDAVAPGTLLIAEANMEPRDVVAYFGDGDECQAAYHFPLMPEFFMALATGDAGRIPAVLSPEVTPEPPAGCSWMTFLRCHDELTLEFASESVRDTINAHFLVSPDHRFREGEGVAGRLFELVGRDPAKVTLLVSMLFATGGSPVLYYGDEVAMEDNRAFFEETAVRTGFRDARFLNRGPMDWDRVARAAADPTSPEGVVYAAYKRIIAARRAHAGAFRGTRTFVDLGDPALYAVSWTNEDEAGVAAVHNLSRDPRTFDPSPTWDALETTTASGVLDPYGHRWFSTNGAG